MATPQHAGGFQASTRPVISSRSNTSRSNNNFVTPRDSVSSFDEECASFGKV